MLMKNRFHIKISGAQATLQAQEDRNENPETNSVMISAKILGKANILCQIQYK